MAIISYINDMRGIKPDYCSKIACNIWDFCITEKMWISVAHIADVSNKDAYKQSSIHDNATHWQLWNNIYFYMLPRLSIMGQKLVMITGQK